MIATPTLPTTEALLVSGGDARIQPDPVSGVSVYGCRSCPDPALVALGSSTASTISAAGFAAADALRCACADRLSHASAFHVYSEETARLRSELPQLCGLPPTAGIQVVLTASGTDLHLLTAQWIKPGRIITVVPTETGSGVSAALQGHHFNTQTAYGGTFAVGDGLHQGYYTSLVTLSPRDARGDLRATEAVNAEYIAHATEALQAGQRVLLVLTDVSKTALIVPEIAVVRALQQRWPDQIEVLVDACQFRLSAETIASYLLEDWMVALTGSKFIAGPAFCGCLLVPPAVATRYQHEALHPSVGFYSSAADWPADWNASRTLPAAVNYGLLLRWEAAATELRAFQRIPQTCGVDFLRTFANTIHTRIETDACFQALPVRPLVRPQPAAPLSGFWDREQTIFPFLLYQPRAKGVARPLCYDETQRVYQTLLQPTATHTERRFQLGQPVRCGSREGVPVGALRLSVSAPMMVAACREGRLAEIIGNACAALDAVARLVIGN